MVEFTDREKAIIHGMGLIMHPMFSQIPPRVRETTYMMFIKTAGLNFSEDELKDLMLGVEAEQQAVMKSGFALLDKAGPALKGIGKTSLKDLFGG